MLGAIETNCVVFTLIIFHNSPTNLWAGIWGGAHYRDDTQSWCDFLKEGDYVRGGEGGRVHVCVCWLTVASHLWATFIAIQGLAWQRELDFSPFSAFLAGMWTPSQCVYLLHGRLESIRRPAAACQRRTGPPHVTCLEQNYRLSAVLHLYPSFSLGHLNYFYIGVTNEGEKRS